MSFDSMDRIAHRGVNGLHEWIYVGHGVTSSHRYERGLSVRYDTLCFC